MTEMFTTEQVLAGLESAVIATDPLGIVQLWNAGAERLYGWSAAEAVGRFILDLAPSISEDDLRTEVLTAVQRGARWKGDYPVRRRDGTTFLVHVTLGPIRDENGRAIGFLGTAADVTRARLAEIAAGVAYGGSPAEVMDALTQAVAAMIGLAGCVIALWGDDGQGLHVAGCWGLPSTYAQKFLTAVRASDDHPAVQAYLSLRPIATDPSPDAQPDAGPRDGDPTEEVGDEARERFSPHRRELWVPLVVRNRAVGVMGAFVAEYVSDDASLRIASGIATHVAPAVDSALLFAAAQEDATLRERRRVSRELHDSLGQTLYSITLLARAAQLGHSKSADGEPRDAATVTSALDDLRALSQSALADAREVITGLRPAPQTGGDLLVLLERRAKVMTAQSGVPVTVTGPVDGISLLPEAEEQLGRIAREALANVAKHASASQVDIQLKVDDEVILEVTDDGCGFEPTHRKPGRFGLDTMRERARLLGGRLEVESTPGDGATVRARCPRSVLTEEKA
jgi:PAS domain S-box-containing protein